jgi:inner membrane protein
VENEAVKRMITISKGWYIISEKDGKLFFNDLRFGLMSLEPNAQEFVFTYEILTDDSSNVKFIEVKKDRRDAKKLLGELWERVKGN